MLLYIMLLYVIYEQKTDPQNCLTVGMNLFSSNHSIMEKTLKGRGGRHLEATKVQIVKNLTVLL